MSYKENYKLIDWSKPIEIVRKPKVAPKRSSLPCPLVFSDEMPETQSMASGEVYTSKSAIRAEYKRLGMIEVGNDPARHKPFKRSSPDKKAIASAVDRAFDQFKSGARPQQKRA
jgi:hypothetical protein